MTDQKPAIGTDFDALAAAPSGRRMIRAAVVMHALLCAAFLSAAADARTLEVGLGKTLPTPSAAAAIAQDGDTIEIEPAAYADCAVWKANGLTIAGKGAGAVVTTKICEGKAIFVVRGADVTISNLTFTGARAADANGTGIRAEGRNLTVRNSRFIDNENGILAAPVQGSTIHILGSEFERNGSCEKACAHGIYINRIDSLIVERSKFTATRVAHHVKSRALSTRLIGNEIRDGEGGASSYLVDVPNGGRLVMEDNVLEKGPLTNNPTAAVVIGAEGVKNPTPELRLVGNDFVNRLPHATIFVRNLAETSAILVNNRLVGLVTPLVGQGAVQ